MNNDSTRVSLVTSVLYSIENYTLGHLDHGEIIL
jgi:hypothetical protein